MITLTTLDFLRDLKVNNTKPWFDAHKMEFTRAYENSLHLVDTLLLSFIPMEPDLAKVSAKDCLFRIYRDIRFSADKSPYKTHLGISIRVGNKKETRAGYYIHIEPGDKSFLVGGLYRPSNIDLKKIRSEIEYNYIDWKAILDEPEFTRYFGSLQPDDQSLSRVPTGFAADSQAAPFLKMTSFIALRSLADVDLVSRTLPTQLLEGMTVVQPIVQFINRSLDT